MTIKLKLLILIHTILIIGFTNPLTWLLVKIQIKGIMKRALMGIKQQAQSNESIYLRTP